MAEQQLHRAIASRISLKQLIQQSFPIKNSHHQRLKSQLLSHLDELHKPMYQRSLKRLQELLTNKDSEEKEQIIKMIKIIKIIKISKDILGLWYLRNDFQQSIFRLPFQTSQEKKLVTFLSSVDYPRTIHREASTDAVVLQFIEHPTTANAKKVEIEFRQKQRQQQQRNDEKKNFKK
jgi:hypothetical protein